MKKIFYGVALLAIAALSACGSKSTQAPLPLPDAAYDSTYVNEVTEAADEQLVTTIQDTDSGEIITDSISVDTVIGNAGTIVPQ